MSYSITFSKYVLKYFENYSSSDSSSDSDNFLGFGLRFVKVRLFFFGIRLALTVCLTLRRVLFFLRVRRLDNLPRGGIYYNGTSQNKYSCVLEKCW